MLTAIQHRSVLGCAGVDLTPPEQRVLGCLLEKQRTTPDQYPLTLNALRLACNQSTNRDPVVDYDEATMRAALERLSRRRWVRYASSSGSRASSTATSSTRRSGSAPTSRRVLCVLLLRGAADAGRAQAAHRAHAPLRRPRRASTRRSTRWSSASSCATSAGARARRRTAGSTCSATTTEAIDVGERRALPRADARRRRPPTRRARRATSAARAREEGRIAALEAQVRALRDELEALRRARRRADGLTWGRVRPAASVRPQWLSGCRRDVRRSHRRRRAERPDRRAPHERRRAIRGAA